ncbi:MAG: PQQ-binding-like beta-propeller repeat protein [Gemmatimonadota bacterium]
MRRTIVAVPLTALLITCCDRAHSVPEPGFQPVFPPLRGELLSYSSPNAADLNGDGVLDIVYGTGVDRLRPVDGRWVLSDEPAIAGYVTAVSGATNDILWRVSNGGEAFTMPRFALLNGDRVPDVLMGGRQGSFAAYDGTSGAVLWRVLPEQVAETPDPYNFFTPATIGDVTGDGVADFVVAYGGNDTRLPEDPRDPGFVVAVSGADGSVLAVHQTPDGRETYSSVVTYARDDGSVWLVFGTGGEKHGGAAYRAPATSLLDGTFADRVEPLISIGEKGVMAPATLVELTNDGELDIVISTFDARLFVIDGSTGDIIWERHDEREESYHPAAVVRVSRDGRLGLFVSRAIGVFPTYAGNVHRLFDARDGTILYQYRDPLDPTAAPLAIDLTGDGIDEPVFFGARGRVHILHGLSGELIVHDVPANFAATPMIVDARGTGALELVGVMWHNANEDGTLAEWRNLSSELVRLDLNATAPAFMGWTRYMGTHADGWFRRPPATE